MEVIHSVDELITCNLNILKEMTQIEEGQEFDMNGVTIDSIASGLGTLKQRSGAELRWPPPTLRRIVNGLKETRFSFSFQFR